MAKEPLQVIQVNGPAELLEQLNALKENQRSDKTEHYFLYCLNQQRSYLKVDSSQKAFHFWYADTADRPATQAVKNVIADFSGTPSQDENFNNIFEDFYRKDLHNKIQATMTGEQMIQKGDPLKRLQEAKLAPDQLKEVAAKAPKTARSFFSLFGRKSSQPQAEQDISEKPKPGK